jgi:lysophospholipase L1-like esterase
VKRWTAIVVGVVALAALGCSSTDSTSSATTASASPPGSEPASAGGTEPGSPGTTAPTPFAEGDTYVALGSSIASGYGISVQSTDCGRSNRNYPNLVAAHHGLALTDVTCGAATIPNVVDTAQGTHPPQLTAVTPDTKLITVTVGGNDIGYNATAVGCGDPQTECTAPAALEANLVTAATALESLLAQIHALAPEATIVLVTYPREVPDGNCPELSFSDSEAAIVGMMGEELEAMFVDVAQRADVVFVDPYPEPGDHTGCAPAAERWTAGGVADDGFAYHPPALGHEVMAQMIIDALGT